MAQTEGRSIENSNTSEQIKQIGMDFITRYYGAVRGSSGAWPLDRFYNKSSVHRQQWFGREPEEALGLDQIKPLLERLKFDECDFAVDSNFTRRPWPTRMTVHTVGRVTHPGRVKPRKFTQRTVFVNFPPSKNDKGRRFLILRTSFKFEHRVKQTDYFAAVDGPKKPTDVPQTGGKLVETSVRTTTAVKKIEPPEDALKDEKVIAKTLLTPTSTNLEESPEKPAKKLTKNMRKKLRRLQETAQGATV